MRLYILRHGVAAERDPRKYPRDAQRPLTIGGRVKMRRAARGMKALGLSFDAILTSPLTRCRQTARIVVRELESARPAAVLRSLAPGGAPREILEALPHVAETGSMLLIGHEPDLSRLATMLLVPMPVHLTIELKKGGLCRIDFDDAPQPGGGRLALLLSPRVLRLMAR